MDEYMIEKMIKMLSNKWVTFGFGCLMVVLSVINFYSGYMIWGTVQAAFSLLNFYSFARKASR